MADVGSISDAAAESAPQKPAPEASQADRQDMKEKGSNFGWAGWLAIGESSFFIPIEIYELVHHYTNIVAIILVVNIIIVWYLLKNRERLFHHP